MIAIFLKPLLLAMCLLVLPFINVGVYRKSLAVLQRQANTSILKPLRDFNKYLQEGQAVSVSTTWIQQISTALGAATMIFIACIVPWVSFKPTLAGDDLFLLLYMLALMRFMSLLAETDLVDFSSRFKVTREVLFLILKESAMFITLASLAFNCHSTNLGAIFDFDRGCTALELPVWLGAAAALIFCSFLELSREPEDNSRILSSVVQLDDPQILDTSGRNVVLSEYTYYLKMAVLYGLSVQCLLHALTFFAPFEPVIFGVLSVVAVFAYSLMFAAIESLMVKAKKRGSVSFTLCAITMSLLTAACALIGGACANHGT